MEENKKLQNEETAEAVEVTEVAAADVTAETSVPAAQEVDVYETAGDILLEVGHEAEPDVRKPREAGILRIGMPLFVICAAVALIVSFAFNVVAYLIFKTTAAISIASIFALLVWYFHARQGLRKICCANQKDTVYMLLMCLGFYICTALDSLFVSGIIYLCVYILISIASFGRDWRSIKSICFNKQ